MEVLHPCSKNGGGQEGGVGVYPLQTQRVRGVNVPHRAQGEGWCGWHSRQGGHWLLPCQMAKRAINTAG